VGTSGIGAGVGGATNSLAAASYAFNTLGLRRNAPYAASPDGDTFPDMANGSNGGAPAVSPKALAEVKGARERSTAVRNGKDITVSVNGPAVVLEGTVPSARDRRLAEALIRLTPGVYEVQNKLKVGKTP